MDLIKELNLVELDESISSLEHRVSSLKVTTKDNVQQLSFELGKANDKKAKVTKILDNTINTVESLLANKKESA